MNSSKSDIKNRSYSPYSGREAFCYVEGKSGMFYPGVRVENISFPLTISAVQGAICSCLANRDQPVAIICDDPDFTSNRLWFDEFDLKIYETFPDMPAVYDPLIKKIDDVKETLQELCKSSVSSQSGFPVSALLVTSKGYVPGVNIEFSEWNLGLCAERVAITRAIVSGYSDFLEMHIYAPKSDYCSPCGACRQVLFEHMPKQMVALHHDEQSTSRHFISHLLPNGFTYHTFKQK